MKILQNHYSTAMFEGQVFTNYFDAISVPDKIYCDRCIGRGYVLVINDKNVPLNFENRIKLPERRAGQARKAS
jgi:hypothetical protein